ncbi:MAG: hypothetical protein Q9222_002717 [Ikaeria aurantiellina]
MISTNISLNNTDFPKHKTLSDEFSGLLLNYNRDPGGPNEFYPEEVALAAITAMKEEATEYYTAILTSFDFVDWVHVEDRVRISMQATQRAPQNQIRRSTVMWALKSLAVELLRTRFLRPTSFTVSHLTTRLYNGALYSRYRAGSEAVDPSEARRHSSTASPLVVGRPNNETSVSFSGPVSLSKNSQFELHFQYLGQSLSSYSIFESILTFLLAFGMWDSSSVQETAGMEYPDLQAWIYMKEAQPPPPYYRLQQYQAVAILEGMARSQVAHARYQEMFFDFTVEGQLLARGCIVRALESRRWCQNLYSVGVFEPSTRLEQRAHGKNRTLMQRT